MTLMTTAPAAPTYVTERGITLADLRAEAAIVRHDVYAGVPEPHPAPNPSHLLTALPEPQVDSAAVALLGLQRDLASL